jgi:two-component system KDP operon response regulator KdpE
LTNEKRQQLMTTILCVDDDPYQTDLLRYGLARAGFAVASAPTGRAGLHQARAEPIDLVILDLDLPDMDGFQVLAALRTSTPLPVILLTARVRDADAIAGLEQGAADYVTTPFSMQVLLARVSAVLRRAPPRPTQVMDSAPAQAPASVVAGALLDTGANELRAPDGTRVHLTPTQSHILQLLLAHKGQALSGAHILGRLGGDTPDRDVNVIKTHVHHLRAKIARLPGRPQPIRTLPDGGYLFRP